MLLRPSNIVLQRCHFSLFRYLREGGPTLFLPQCDRPWSVEGLVRPFSGTNLDEYSKVYPDLLPDC
jgi:hypothetical protein